MEKYIEGQKITPEEIKAGIRKGVVTNKLVPVLCGSAFKNKGIQPLMDAVVDYLPSPLDVPPVEGIRVKDDETVTREASDNEPFSALAFKIMTDPYVGKLTFFRVYSGTLDKGANIYNANKGKRERLNRILRMHANRREEVEKVYAGDIVAGVGLTILPPATLSAPRTTRSSLRTSTSPIQLSPSRLSRRPRPTRTRWASRSEAGQPKTRPSRLTPTKRPARRSSPGMGELHLEIILDRLYREFKVEANHGKPQVAYKETITTSLLRARAAMSSRPADTASMDTSLSRWSRARRVPGSSSSTR